MIDTSEIMVTGPDGAMYEVAQLDPAEINDICRNRWNDYIPDLKVIIDSFSQRHFTYNNISRAQSILKAIDEIFEGARNLWLSPSRIDVLLTSFSLNIIDLREPAPLDKPELTGHVITIPTELIILTAELARRDAIDGRIEY